MFVTERSNPYRELSIYASYQVKVHLAKRFARRRFIQKQTNQKQELPVAAIFVNGSEIIEQSLQRTFQECFPPNFNSFGQGVSEEKICQKSINQKQELPVATICLVTDPNEINNLHREPFIDASYQVLAQRFQRRYFRNQPIRYNKDCLWWPCFLLDQNEMSSNLYRGPSMDDSYRVSVHLAKRFQRRRFF